MKNITEYVPKHIFNSSNMTKVNKNQIIKGLNFSPEDITSMYQTPSYYQDTNSSYADENKFSRMLKSIRTNKINDASK